MKKLKKIENVVEKVLVEKEETRSNDDILYLYVCENFTDDVSSMSLKDFLLARKNLNCPPFESVRRSRQKVFSRRPELKPEVITECREKMEEIYKEYALN